MRHRLVAGKDLGVPQAKQIYGPTSDRRDTYAGDQKSAGSLSDGERLIVALACLGLKNRQIADLLHLIDRELEQQLNSIFIKLSVDDRLELIIYAFGHGLVPRSDVKPSEQ